jgi:LPXTG-site transpeptidase (sortase) family protein
VPAVPPVSIRIPGIDVSAPVMQLGLNSDGTIQVPPLESHNLAGWYKYGASPGQKGAAVIVGHIDSTTGPSVFFRLRDLHTGDLIYVNLDNGHVATFAVDGLQQVPKTSFPTASVYGHLAYAGLRLVTCGGVFNPATGSYLSDVIVYAHLVT